MDKKYSSGNEYISDTFSLCNYEINLNNTNNRLNYSFNLFPFSKPFFNLNIIFENLVINNYKYDIYYSFTYLYPDHKYRVYDALGDYEELEFSSGEEDYDIYSSMNYNLYYYYNHDDNAIYELYDKNSLNSYLFKENSNYPFKIFLSNGYYVELTFDLNNRISKITCFNEEINFTYNLNKTTIELSKKLNVNNNTINFLCAETQIEIVNLVKTITYYIYEFHVSNWNYEKTHIQEIYINKSMDHIQIQDRTTNYHINFYETNDKIIQITECHGNTFITNISYSSNITTVANDDKNYKVIYDNNNMKKYIIYDDRYIKYYEYNTDYLLSYESDYINNMSLINDDLLDFDVITYEPGEDDYDDYSFDIEAASNQIIPTHLSSFITSNDIYHIEGYGELEYLINEYGESSDSNSLFFLYKIVSGYFYAEIIYYCGNDNHSSRIKMINSSIGSDFNPFIMGLKPGYSYDGIKIRLFINGEIYINTPKVNKEMGTYYSYNNNYKLNLIMNNEGNTSYAYYNGRISSITSLKSTINYTRDVRGNITTENIDGYITTRTYDTKNRITSENNPMFNYSYQYEERYEDSIYEYIESITNNIIPCTTVKTYDNNGNLIGIGKPVMFSGNVINDYDILYYYDHDLLTKVDDNEDISTYAYDNKNRLVNIYDTDISINNNYYDTRYLFSYSQNNREIGVQYYINSNNYKNLAYKIYDTKDRIISKQFNGTYTFEYLTNPKKINISYENNPKYEINYNNYDHITSDDYNNITYDIDNSIKQDVINNITFKYHNDNISFKDSSNNNYYESNTYGYNKLKNDPYYANITYHLNNNVGIINTSISAYNSNISYFYPLQSSYLSIDGDTPKSFTKQGYKPFYYDKDINNYAALLYGTRIIYETNILNNGRIIFEIKLEPRNLDQLIIKITSRYKELEIYRNTNGYLVYKWQGITTTTNKIITSNNWYRFDIVFDNNLLEIYYIKNDGGQVTTITESNTIYQNDTNIEIELGELIYYYNHKTTFGLIRYLNIINTNLINDTYINNITKTDSYDYRNNLLINEEVRYNNIVIYNKNNSFYVDTTDNLIYYSGVYRQNISSTIGVFNNICVKKTNTIIYNNQTISYNHTYSYDDKSRITTEELNKNSNTSYLFEYEYYNTNNIKKYSFIIGDSTILTRTYNYNQTFKTILDSINITENNNTTNYPITYDNTGLLPISFMGNTYSYEGKRLISFNNYNYQYNVYGRRIRKYTNDYSTDIHYYYDTNNRLILEDRGSYKLKYLYDSKGELYGFYHIFVENNSTVVDIYFYIKDKLGIIQGIMDISSNIVGIYEYDSYGYIINIEQSNNIVIINPIRYKSYYYDTESDMYYLNNRYYYPVLCRFITPDNYEYIDINNRKTLNLYAYCYNNPVMYSDGEGTFAITATVLLIGGLIAGGVGAGIGLGTAIYKDYKEDEIFFNGDWTDYLGRTLGGFVTGFGIGVATVLGAGVGAAALGGTTATLFSSTGLSLSMGSAIGIGSGFAFATGMAGYTTRALISRSESYSVGNMLLEGGMNAVSGALSVLGGALGGYAGVHNTVFTRLLSQKGDLLYRILIENMFTVGFKISLAVLKALIEG